MTALWSALMAIGVIAFIAWALVIVLFCVAVVAFMVWLIAEGSQA